MRAPRSSYDDEFNDLYARAYRVAFRILQDRGEAEDVAQESMIRAYVRWKKVKAFPGPWVAKVSGNLAIDKARATTRRVRREDRAVLDSQQPTEGPVDNSDLRDALLSLSPRQQEVVVLRYLADLSESTVSQVLGCSPGTVKTHASRGLQALRFAMGDPA